MGTCNSRMYFGRADRFTPPVMEGPQRAICGACWHCHTCDDRLCSGAPPEGMRFNGTQLRSDHWAADSRPVLHGYDANRFSTFHWEVDSFRNKTLVFGRGGNQAGQGVYTMAEIFVENVLFELDQPGEWYLDTTSMTLYLWPNTTDGQPPQSLIAPHLEILVEAHGRGDYAPVQNITFNDINFEHTVPTILSPRGYSVLLGGGDYAMVKAAAVVAENVDGFTIDGCSFSRLDGNAVMLYSFVRRALISNNIFFSLGANVSGS